MVAIPTVALRKTWEDAGERFESKVTSQNISSKTEENYERGQTCLLLCWYFMWQLCEGALDTDNPTGIKISEPQAKISLFKLQFKRRTKREISASQILFHTGFWMSTQWLLSNQQSEKNEFEEDASGRNFQINWSHKSNMTFGEES